MVSTSHFNFSKVFSKSSIFCSSSLIDEVISFDSSINSFILWILSCSIDNELSKKYKNYIRYIDDYSCYVETREEAEQFLIDLNKELRKFDLLMNHKKTEIEELPICVVDTWIHKIQNQTVNFQKHKDYICF